MTFDVSSEPYAPNLVPATRSEDDPTRSIQNLERFLAEELQRIQTALEFVPVQAAYGALIVINGPVADQPLVKDTPTPIGGFNSFAPEVPNRVTAEETGSVDSLQPEEAGVYLMSAQVTATIDAGTSYIMTFANGGVLSDIFGAIDAGNQTTFATITLTGLVSLKAGDLITLVMVATAGQPGPFTFIMESASFNLIRVSELHKGD
jgi:hypothetical protein